MEALARSSARAPAAGLSGRGLPVGRLVAPVHHSAQPRAVAFADVAAAASTSADVASTSMTTSAWSWRQCRAGGSGNHSAAVSCRRGRRTATVAAAASPAAASGPAAAEPAASVPKNLAEGDIVSPKREAKLTLEQYKEIYDRLINIFQTRPRDDWKKLIVFSKQWEEHYNGVFDRIKERAEAEPDLDKKMAMRKLFRALQNVNDELKRYNGLLLKLGEAADDEWEAVVAAYRGDLQKPFFEHMQCLIAAAKDDAAKREGLVLLNTRLVALIANHDAVAAEPEKLAAAAELYRDLLSSVTSMEDLDKKMAELGSSGRIDPAFLQISAKAYGAARDTNMSKDEAKWVAYKLYRHARDYFDRQQPAEKRIIEYLLTVTDPTERRNLLDKAITPGPVRMTETHDYLYSTPQRLFIVLDNTLRAYHLMRDGAAKNLNTPEAAVLPRKVRVMMELRDEIIRRYL